LYLSNKQVEIKGYKMKVKSYKKKMSRKEGLSLVDRGYLTMSQFDELVQDGTIAGQRTKSAAVKFAGTDMTTYFPNIRFSKSAAKGANNVVTTPMRTLHRKWNEQFKAQFDTMVAEFAEVSNDVTFALFTNEQDN
jgi:hypothetical protein